MGRSNKKIRLYKFRPLATELDFYRLKEILETGSFWCSKFSELNDPMEGVFITFDPEYIRWTNVKEECRICSFSGAAALTKPCMWGYYANGFRGVAIGIDMGSEDVYEEGQNENETVNNKDVLNKIYKIYYRKDIPQVSGNEPIRNVKEILTAKLPAWKHECEYRFLTNHNEHKIGDIKCLVFGAPYLESPNFEQTVQGSKSLRRYYKYGKKIGDFVKKMDADKKITLYWAISGNERKVNKKPWQKFIGNFDKILHILENDTSYST